MEADDCPVSCISPRSRTLVQLTMQAAHVGKSGAAFGGPDSSQWPEWWFDAVAVVEQQKILEHNARVAAEIRKR